MANGPHPFIPAHAGIQKATIQESVTCVCVPDFAATNG
jgi:hypothetical protein